MGLPLHIFLHALVGGRCTAELQERVPVFVRCEDCGDEYVYFARLHTEGDAPNPMGLRTKSAMEEANRKAQADMVVAKARCVCAVPCPSCGGYQNNMCDIVRESLYGQKARISFIVCGIFLAPVLVLLLASSDLGGRFAPPWMAVIPGLPALFFAGRAIYLSWNEPFFKPNSIPKSERLAIAKTYAISKAEFLAHQANYSSEPSSTSQE